MNRERIAERLLTIAEELTAASDVESLFKGKFFEADRVEESLDVVMTKRQSGGTFSRSEVADMIKELQKILALDKKA